MIDLYKKYGLKPYEADPEKIRQALSRPPYMYKGTIEYVLLHQGRKTIYDRTHETLSLIGEIRSRLDLTNSHNWGHSYEDFNIAPQNRHSPERPHARENRKEPDNNSTRTNSPNVKKRFTFLRGDLYVVLVVSVFIMSYFFGDDGNTGNSNGRTSPNTTSSKPASKPKTNQRMHVTAKALNVRAQPNAQSDIVGQFSQYEDIYKLRSENSGWAYVRAKNSGIEGYVSTTYIDSGDGWSGWIKACRAAGISRPQNGAVLAKSGYGNHKLVVNNSPGTDALVKLKDVSGNTVISMYVRAGQSAEVNVPEGRFQFQYASGKDYSSSCGRFLVDMSASKDPNYTSFIAEQRYNGIAYGVQTYTLRRVAHGNFKPRSMDASDF